MRLAIVSPGELFGGVERQIHDICRYLLRSDLGPPQVILFHDGELARQLRELGLEPVILSARNRYDRQLLRQLETTLAQAGCEVVHAHGYKATITCALVKSKLGFRLVKTEHGRPEASWRQPVAWLKSRLNFQLEQALTRKAVDHVCYVTEDIARFFEKPHRGVARSVVHNGIDPLDRSALARPSDLTTAGFSFGIIGRVSEVKGIPFALEALTHPDLPPGARLVILGTGEIVASLQRSAAALGVADRVEFLGFRQNIYDYIAHVDAVLMPSLHEGLPYTVLEAMSLGRPIIASRVGGLPEVLTDTETGHLVPVGDVEGLAHAMRDLVQQTEAAQAMGQAGRLAQARHFTLDGMAAKYRDIWTGDPH